MRFKKLLFGLVVFFILFGTVIYVWAQQRTGSEQVTIDRIYYKLEEIAGQLKDTNYDQINKKLDQIIQTQANIQEDLTKLKMRQRY
ncbi:MAG: hypothetical protein AB1472_05025 [Candidatus Omnitrophota bacterium]